MSIYPEINLPKIATPQSQRLKYSPAPNFNFATGEFIFDGHGRMIFADGQEAFAQWCMKTCMVERATRLAYSDKIGVEMVDALKQPTAEAVKSSVARAITEAILVHPMAEYVKNFAFRIEADKLQITFTVKGRNLPEFPLTVIY